MKVALLDYNVGFENNYESCYLEGHSVMYSVHEATFRRNA
jgi:hypothetical protein